MTKEEKRAAKYVARATYFRELVESLPPAGRQHVARWRRPIEQCGRASNRGALEAAISFAESVVEMTTSLAEAFHSSSPAAIESVAATTNGANGAAPGAS